MIIKCIIIDDEMLAINIIETYLKQFDNFEIVGTYTNPLKAYEILGTEKIDVIFLDINMPQMSGLEFIESLNQSPSIVITTAYREHAVKSYELNVLDYLIKPIPFDRFLKTVNKIQQLVFTKNVNTDVKLTQEPHFFLKANKKLIKVNFNDILFIESLKDYVKVATNIGNYVVHKSLTTITEELPSSNFMRIHRSFTIAINKVISLEGNLIEIANKKIPIGRNYNKQTKERIFNQKTTKL